MFQFIESIAIENGVAPLADMHHSRMQRTAAAHFTSFDLPHPLELIKVPAEMSSSKVKCRILYSNRIEKIEYEPYQARAIRHLRLVNGDHVAYHFKFADRTALDDLFALRADCDDILIQRNGLITDTSIANVLLLKDGIWYTPERPLLMGVQREMLIVNGTVVPASIAVADLFQYEKIMCVNAMNGFDLDRAINITEIIY